MFWGKQIAPALQNDVLRRSKLQELIDCINPLLKVRVVLGSTPNITLDDNGLIIQVPNGGGGAGGGGGALATYRLKSVQGDYITCRTWDGASDGPVDVLIAKPWRLRESVTALTIYGVAHTYTYAAGPDGDNRERINAWPVSQTELELVSPAWVGNELIYAFSGVYTGAVDGSGHAITNLMTSDNRQWAKI